MPEGNTPGTPKKTESWKVKGSHGKSERMNQNIMRFLEAHIFLFKPRIQELFLLLSTLKPSLGAGGEEEKKKKEKKEKSKKCVPPSNTSKKKNAVVRLILYQY